MKRPKDWLLATILLSALFICAIELLAAARRAADQRRQRPQGKKHRQHVCHKAQPG